MSKAIRDRSDAGPHSTILSGYRFEFGEDGLMHNPTPEERALLQATPARASRFQEVDVDEPTTLHKAPDPDAATLHKAGPDAGPLEGPGGGLESKSQRRRRRAQRRDADAVDGHAGGADSE